jgi:hypothetical protein
METIGGNSRPYLADGVGVITGNRSGDFYVEDRSLVDARVNPNNAPIFEEAFTEYVWMTDRHVGSSDIPYDGVIPHYAMYLDPGGAQGDTQREWTARKWVRHAARFVTERNALPDHQSLFLASRHDANGLAGVTTVADGFNDTWIFLDTIHSASVAREALVHELGHQWSLNDRYFLTSTPTDPVTGGHCDTAFGCGGTNHAVVGCSTNTGLFMFHGQDLCLMTSSFYADPANSNGQVGFHYVIGPNGQPDSEWLRIRRREEPVPQFENRLSRNPQ